VGQETYVIIVTKDVLVGKTIATRIAQFPTVDAHCILPLHKYSCDVGNEETMLTISVVGFLNSLWRTTLLKLSLMQQCAKWYSCSQEESDHRSIALSTIPKLSILHCLTSRWFYRWVVRSIRVQTEGCRELLSTLVVMIPDHCFGTRPKWVVTNLDITGPEHEYTRTVKFVTCCESSPNWYAFRGISVCYPADSSVDSDSTDDFAV